MGSAYLVLLSSAAAMLVMSALFSTTSSYVKKSSYSPIVSSRDQTSDDRFDDGRRNKLNEVRVSVYDLYSRLQFLLKNKDTNT